MLYEKFEVIGFDEHGGGFDDLNEATAKAIEVAEVNGTWAQVIQHTPADEPLHIRILIDADGQVHDNGEPK